MTISKGRTLRGVRLLCLLSLLFGASPAEASLVVGEAVPDVVIGNFDPGDWSGKPYVVNFFATWCLPCRLEQGSLDALSQAGIPVVGIAYKNSAYKVERLLENDNPYASLAYDPRGLGGRNWDISGVPETFVVDARGTIRGHFASPLTPFLLESDVLPLWRRLKISP